MKNNLSVFVLMLMLATIISCSKNKEGANPASGELTYFVFGHFYGECGGEACVEIYKLENEKLWEDTTDVYPTSISAYEGVYIQLTDEKYELVKDIVDSFPEELYEEENNVLGNPDGGDWGGIYVEIKYADDESKSGFWLLDQNAFNMPDVYNTYVTRINEKINFINQ